VVVRDKLADSAAQMALAEGNDVPGGGPCRNAPCAGVRADARREARGRRQGLPTSEQQIRRPRHGLLSGAWSQTGGFPAGKNAFRSLRFFVFRFP
jgi:hypothetical protein